MLFHEALHHVFTTFSRQVLQQGRLTACLADCAVFDTFDDHRTICLTIDLRYGARLYACLSHSPYKQQFDAIIAEVKQLHPTINPLQVDYVFQSIRYAWGKIKSVRPPKAPVLFDPPKKRPKRPASPPYTIHPTPKKRQRRSAPTPYMLHPTPKKYPKRQKRTTYTPYTIPNTPQTIHWKLLFKSIGMAILQILLYVVLVQCLVGGFVFLIEGRWYGLIGMLIGVILIYILYRKHNP